jgi:hypothetical protein
MQLLPAFVAAQVLHAANKSNRVMHIALKECQTPKHKYAIG